MFTLLGLAFALSIAPSGLKPTVFAPGIISGSAHDSAPAFSPDGKTVFFGRSTSVASFILVSRRGKMNWTAPVIAPFSGRWLDMEPAMSPDGSYMIFSSNRPATPNGRPVDGEANGKSTAAGRGSNLWRVDRTATGWGEPVRLPDIVNTSGSTYAPSIAGDGTLYFMRPNPTTHRFQLLRAESTAAGYAAPTALPFSDGGDTDVDPAVARDQTFIIFGSGRHLKKDIDLFIAYRTADGWSAPLYLGDEINSPTSDAEPRLSPDNRTLYFSSERVVLAPTPIPKGRASGVLGELSSWNNGLYNIWSVDLTQLTVG